MNYVFRRLDTICIHPILKEQPTLLLVSLPRQLRRKHTITTTTTFHCGCYVWCQCGIRTMNEGVLYGCGILIRVLALILDLFEQSTPIKERSKAIIVFVNHTLHHTSIKQSTSHTHVFGLSTRTTNIPIGRKQASDHYHHHTCSERHLQSYCSLRWRKGSTYVILPVPESNCGWWVSYASLLVVINVDWCWYRRYR